MTPTFANARPADCAQELTATARRALGSLLCDARSGYGGIQPRRIAFQIRRTHVTISRSKSYAARRPPQAVTSLRNNETQGVTSRRECQVGRKEALATRRGGGGKWSK